MDARALLTADGASIAYRLRPGRGPTLLWLGGFGSDMDGQKAAALDDLALQEGLAFLRFDYFGHGSSSGAFEDGTVSRWLADAVEVADRLTEGELLPIGSSMGAWIAVHLAQKRAARVCGLVLIAPALDFTSRLLEPSLPQEARDALLADGRWVRPSAYAADGLVITRRLIEDGRTLELLPGPLGFAGPVRILQGGADPDVPWRHALATALAFSGEDVAF